MIGRMQITTWRQCNAVTPAVTATQTGAGTHNGMALTVKVLTGTNITVNGPQYQSVMNPGASGSANANAPASVTLTPQGTGSWMAGAVNRVNSATAWTPSTSTVFSQNIADAVNGATYGTFNYGSTVSTPVLAASYPVYDNNADAASLVTGSFTPAVGEVLVVKVTTPAVTVSWPSGLPSGGGLTFTQQVTNPGGGSFSATGIWTSSPVTVSSAMTVTVPFAGSTQPHSMVVERWSGAVIAAMPVTCKALSGSGNPTSSLVTQVTSAVSWCSSDYSAINGSSRTYNTTSATPAEDGYVFNTPYYTAYYATQAASSAGSQTIGLTAPSSQIWNICGMEILAAETSGVTVAGIPVTIGASNGDGASGVYGGVAVAEFLASGTIAEDPSTPPPVNTTAATSVSTALFNPPMGSLLVAKVATAGGTGVQVTDSNGGLTWVELARWASGTSGYAGVWAAVVVTG